jgi:uncharacterized protein YecT (DUF1311 family)
MLDESEASWAELRNKNCLIEEASVYDGSARLNAVTDCKLRETELRNKRLDEMIELYGGSGPSSRRSARKASVPAR